MNPVMDRPIRVVFFGGAFPEHGARRFVALLATHPEVELVGGVCQSAGFGLLARLADIVRRRGVLAPIAIGAHVFEAVRPLLRDPPSSREVRRAAALALRTMRTVPDIHAPDVLEYVRSLDPDLGLIYGSPILRQELFAIPRLGTLGIHHGTLPAYRGRKTTFWEVHNGEPSAGIVIQRISERLDAGEIVAQHDVPIDGRGYWSVSREVNEAGVELFLDTVLSVQRGTATLQPAPSSPGGPTYREPRARDWLRLVRHGMGRTVPRRPAPE
jgi:folate-dependent phosphoribosylglycinamide formyltransferase PurN